MSGHVYYRFKSQKEPARITFDGVGISVFDLKREIILDSKMGRGADFDFALFSADGQDEYKNDHIVVPRSTTVIAQRRPPKKPGQGNAQIYVADVVAAPARAAPAPHADWRGGGAIVKDFRQKDAPKVEIIPTADGGDRDAEAESMAAMFAAQEQQWQETQETMATQTRVGRNIGFRGEPRPGNRFEHTRPPREFQPRSAKPPDGYICYRCGSKEHWIQDCPTNNDPQFDGKPRIKRTTGIPKSFLQKIEGKPEEGQNVMVMPDGTLVIAKPDDASWQQHKAVVVKNLTAADIQNLQPSDPDLACSICTKLLKDAVTTPCCGSAFCDSCIRAHLQEHGGVCPECESKVPKGVDGLIVDEDRRLRAADYVNDLVRASKEAAAEGSSDEEGVEASGTPAAEGSVAPASEPSRAGSEAPVAEPKHPEVGEIIEDGPTATEMQARLSNDGSVRSASASRQSVEPEAVPGRSGTGTPSGGGAPPGMNMNGFGMMMMNNGGMPNLAMLQQQFMQQSMMLQNPTLPPPVRAQIMMARQQVNNQIIMLQQQAMATAAMQQQQQQMPPQQGYQLRRPPGNPHFRGAAPSRGGGRFNLSDFQARLQQHQGVPVPTDAQQPYQRRAPNGRRAAPPPKRGRSEDVVELTTGEFAEEPPEKVARQE